MIHIPYVMPSEELKRVSHNQDINIYTANYDVKVE